MDQSGSFIDFRQASANNMSLDLARHLPCRLHAGRTVVVADNPRIFSSVLCRRWVSILKEVEIQVCSTMDREKRQILRQELKRLAQVHISSKDSDKTNVLVIKPQVLSDCSAVATLYLTTSTTQLASAALRAVQPGGLIVVYRDLWEPFSHNLQQHIVASQRP